MRGNMIAHIDWLLTEPATKLGYVRYRDVIESPKNIFIKGKRALF